MFIYDKIFKTTLIGRINMKKLFDKDEIWFAVVWIIIYVLGFSNADMLSESIGMPKLITCIFGFLMAAILFVFIKKHKLSEYFGLCAFKGNYKKFLYFIPLIIISSVNFWNGLKFECSFQDAALFISSMCLVAILEETYIQRISL